LVFESIKPSFTISIISIFKVVAFSSAFNPYFSLSKQKGVVDMSPMRLVKKLKPAKKAFKATFKRLLTTFHSLNHLVPSKGSKTSHVHRHSKNKSVIIQIDDLFPEHAQTADKARAQEETSRSNSEDIDTIEDAWKIVVGKSPQLQVDDRAEEFINKFYEDVRLQKERSLMEYQEMLARSA
jgi:hypothetical protein